MDVTSLFWTILIGGGIVIVILSSVVLFALVIATNIVAGLDGLRVAIRNRRPSQGRLPRNRYGRPALHH